MILKIGLRSDLHNVVQGILNNNRKFTKSEYFTGRESFRVRYVFVLKSHQLQIP